MDGASAAASRHFPRAGHAHRATAAQLQPSSSHRPEPRAVHDAGLEAQLEPVACRLRWRLG